MTKIELFDKNWAFWQQLSFLTKIELFDQNWAFWQKWAFWCKLGFLTIIEHFDKKWAFWLNSNIFDENCASCFLKLIPFTWPQNCCLLSRNHFPTLHFSYPSFLYAMLFIKIYEPTWKYSPNTLKIQCKLNFTFLDMNKLFLSPSLQHWRKL